MADYDVVFVKVAEAVDEEPETFHLSTPDADADGEMQELEEIRRLVDVLDEPEFSTYAST